MGVSEWHRNSGVCSQYGYEFQKYAFIYYMMKYHNLYNVYMKKMMIVLLKVKIKLF